MKTSILDVARSLSDQDLLDSLPVLAGNERHSSVALIVHLAALQERSRLYEGLGFGSLFEYCTSRLRLSEDATCTRTAVAGACRRFPVILELLATGATNLTNIRRLAGKLTPENHEAILARAVHKTRDEIEVLVRELDPLPDLRSSVRKVAGPGERRFHRRKRTSLRKGRSTCRPPKAGRRSPPHHPILDRSSGPRRRSATTSSSRSARKRTGSSGASRPCCAARSPTEIPARSSIAHSRVFLEKVEKRKLGATAKPRRGPSIRSGTDRPVARPSRHIPSEVKRVVSKRDADQCAFVSPAGRRCTQRAFLEFHHVQPVRETGSGDGGEHLSPVPRPQRLRKRARFRPLRPVHRSRNACDVLWLRGMTLFQNGGARRDWIADRATRRKK